MAGSSTRPHQAHQGRNNVEQHAYGYGRRDGRGLVLRAFAAGSRAALRGFATPGALASTFSTALGRRRKSCASW